MLNNFCFHVYAQKSLFIAENCNGFFGTASSSSSSPFPVSLDVIELVPSYKSANAMSERIDKEEIRISFVNLGAPKLIVNVFLECIHYEILQC